MTDDYNPIELSWDWQTGGKAPKVRFSIEAVGSEAGTPRDPDNTNAAFEFRRALPRLVPGTNMALLKHFQEQLVDSTRSTEGGEGHATKEFYAFDLGRDGSVISKAYFFPGCKAKSAGKSSLDVVSEAIHSAPDSSAEKVQALDQIREFLDDAKLTSVEIEMLAIDLIDPAESRFKIYFRVRDTSFASFRHVTTLGGRLPDSPEQRRGLAEMKKLYKKLFVPQHTESSWDEQTQLPLTDHRTAGLLYFAEFRYGSAFPKFKAYLPVRHYAASEEATIAALQDHLQDNTYMDAYITAVRAVL
ncbi:aromatic prenyltransferase [Sarocladium strictum]